MLNNFLQVFIVLWIYNFGLLLPGKKPHISNNNWLFYFLPSCELCCAPFPWCYLAKVPRNLLGWNRELFISTVSPKHIQACCLKSIILAAKYDSRTTETVHIQMFQATVGRNFWMYTVKNLGLLHNFFMFSIQDYWC